MPCQAFVPDTNQLSCSVYVAVAAVGRHKKLRHHYILKSRPTNAIVGTKALKAHFMATGKAALCQLNQGV
jgi:hypothetical protein